MNALRAHQLSRQAYCTLYRRTARRSSPNGRSLGDVVRRCRTDVDTTPHTGQNAAAGSAVTTWTTRAAVLARSHDGMGHDAFDVSDPHSRQPEQDGPTVGTHSWLLVFSAQNHRKHRGATGLNPGPESSHDRVVPPQIRSAGLWDAPLHLERRRARTLMGTGPFGPCGQCFSLPATAHRRPEH